MAKSARIQSYPRVQHQDGTYNDLLDDSKLVSHLEKIPVERLRTLIKTAFQDANKKSSRAILSIPAEAREQDLQEAYKAEGRKLLKYFKQYCVDPPKTAREATGKHYRDIGLDLFRRRSLQSERMNTGWRYQYLTLYCARETGRFQSVSGIGTKTDFNAIIAFKDSSQLPLNLYVSVKNRRNTIGGQDFPNSVRALENIAVNDKNRQGTYCCIFGVAIDTGGRQIRRDENGRPHSSNTEIWLSDYFWPFFTGYSYEELMLHVLEVLEEDNELVTEVPEEVLNAFGQFCYEAELVNDQGYFYDSRRLVRFFVNRSRKNTGNKT